MSKAGQSSKPWQDADTLHRLYWVEGLSLADIGENFGREPNTILYWMEKNGVKRRDCSEATTQSLRVEYATRFIGQNGYERWSDWISGERFAVHQLLAIADGADPHEVFDEDTVTHHEFGHPLDNRRGNIEVMGRSEHNSHHRNKDVPECKLRVLQSAAIMEEERA